jgi:hypothetical protein
VRQSIDLNTDWSERARAATWSLVTCDPVTGGESGLPLMTPMRKLFFHMTRLAPDPYHLWYLRCALAKRRKSSQRRLEDRSWVNPHAAGLDIGSEEIVVAVPPDRDERPVRAFATCTPDRHALVDWLLACDIDTVVMESTGMFWVPMYALLEQRGIRPYLVHARHVKTVPGRTSDWNDAPWLQKLYIVGLLQGSFRPDAEVRTLHTLVRSRAEVIARRTSIP